MDNKKVILNTENSIGCDTNKKYCTPTLTQIGKLSELTQGSTSRTNDPGGSITGKF